MASSSANQASAQLPMRPCKGSGKTFPLEANYTTLSLPKLVVHRFAVTIVQLNKGKVDMPGPAKPATPVGQKTHQAGQPATGKPKAAVAIPATPQVNPWKTGNVAISMRASSKAAASTPVVNPDLSAAIPSRPAASGGATTAGNSDPAAPTPETHDEQRNGGPTGKKAEQIIKLFLDLPALQRFKKGIFTDFRALLFSTQDLPPNALNQVVRYRAEYNDTATPNALEYLVKLNHTAEFDIARLTARPGARVPQLDVVVKQDMIQALNILFLHHGRSSPSRLSVGSRRSFSSLNPREVGSSWDIGEGIAAMRGYFSSVYVVDYGILVNVNVSHGSFFQAGSLLNLMRRIDSNFRNRPGTLHVILRGVRIGQKHFTDPSGKSIPFEKRTKTIIGFATGSDGRYPANQQPQPYHPPRMPRSFAGPEDVEFWYEERAESSQQGGYYISVADYFRRCYPRWARLDKHLPVVNVGSVKQPTYLPVEVCEVMHGQPYRKRLNANQTSEMIRFAVRQSHLTRKSIIDEGFEAVGLYNPQMSLLNIRADTKMIVVGGRLLTSPRILYSKTDSTLTEYARIRSGGWDLRNVNFRKAQQLSSWSWLNIADERRNYGGLVDPVTAVARFKKALEDTGIKLDDPIAPDYIKLEDASDKVLHQWFSDCRSSFNLDLIVVMLPDKDAHRYNTIKRIGDVEVGIHTICVVRENFCKQDKWDNKQTFANIALKANLKLKGLNHELDRESLGIIGENKTMVVGIDVTHPSPGSESDCPSVAAMVASVDGNLGQWPAALSLQYCPKVNSDPRQPREKKLDPRQEMVSEIGSMLGSRLDLWCNSHSDVPPENILIYRDGVSEGQYQAVMEMELRRMKEYCAEYYGKKQRYSPRFTLIVVAKRHHTRFFRPVGGSFENPTNGTVVDRGVTGDQTWDFFLQSHTPLQGTGRPAHYIVLHNQVFSRVDDGPRFCKNIADVVERITHNMCYMYSRATKSVSYCPAAYYADRACERGRAYLSRFFVADSMATGSLAKAEDSDIKVKEPLTDTMFYI